MQEELCVDIQVKELNASNVSKRYNDFEGVSVHPARLIDRNVIDTEVSPECVSVSIAAQERQESNVRAPEFQVWRPDHETHVNLPAVQSDEDRLTSFHSLVQHAKQ